MVRSWSDSVFRALVLATAALGAAPDASAQLDLTVDSIQVTQAFQSGTSSLTGGRSTLVRATLLVSGSGADVPGVDGILRIYDGGVEVAGSPVFSTNGPMTARLAPSLGGLNHTLNFLFLPPESDDVVLTVQVNPPGPNHVAEIDTANNLGSTATLDFETRAVPELAYAPIDNDSTGGSNPNAPDPALIEPGVGDNFLQGVFPGKDWFYHRIDAPTKLWTGSIASSSGGQALNNSLVVDANLMVPVPDYIYGWAPGALPGYNGTAQISGKASMGNSELIRHQRTFAHEVGHCFGLFHNSTLINQPSVDVEHHLSITQSLPQIKPGTLSDIMRAGLLTHEAWIATSNWEFFSNHATYQVSPATADPEPEPWRGPSLIVTGLWDRATGAMQATDVLSFTGGELSEPVSGGAANLRVRAWAGGDLVREVPLRAEAALDCGDEPDEGDGPDGARGGAHDAEGGGGLTGFHVVLEAGSPSGAPIDRIEVATRGSGGDGWSAPALVLTASPSAPEVAFTSPLAGLVTERVFDVSWTGADADGDPLQYYLVYRPDGGERRVPIVTSLDVTSVTVDLGDMPGLVDGRGFFELYASDGLHTTRVESVRLSAPDLGVANNAPWIEIMTPDDGQRARVGSSVVLHSSGWDLEDRGLTGASIEWSSDVDGFLGTGRLMATADLQAGAHVLTVTATDSGGLMTTDTASIIIQSRGLPAVDGPWEDLGFALGGTHGEPQLAGTGDLVAGNPMSIDLTGALENAPAFLFVGFSAVNLPFFFGGTLVPDPNPPGLLMVVVTDPSGELSLGSTWPGGLGSGFEIFLQYWIEDAGGPFGYSASNGLKGTTP